MTISRPDSRREDSGEIEVDEDIASSGNGSAARHCGLEGVRGSRLGLAFSCYLSFLRLFVDSQGSLMAGLRRLKPR